VNLYSLLEGQGGRDDLPEVFRVLGPRARFHTPAGVFYKLRRALYKATRSPAAKRILYSDVERVIGEPEADLVNLGEYQ
jgi:hypothetical protein